MLDHSLMMKRRFGMVVAVSDTIAPQLPIFYVCLLHIANLIITLITIHLH